MRSRSLITLVAVALIASCQSSPPRQPAAGSSFPVIDEAFLSTMDQADNIDSPAAWHAPDGTTWVLASAKASDRIIAYDGSNGARLGAFGRSGSAAGEFRRPNGVSVIDDLLFVVERDNHRVQVLALPSFDPLLLFGADELRYPYGLWVGHDGDGYVVHVTDSYQAADDAVPPLAELDQRVRRYRIDHAADGSLRARSLGAYGDTGPEGALRIVESIWADPANDRVLIAEEDESWANEIKLYTLAGDYANRRFGADVVDAQAEGIALYACTDGGGYWLTTAQGKTRTTFHLFDRNSLAYIGAFNGRHVANTDGVWLSQTVTSRFPAGAFYAVHDDQGVIAFDWRDIAIALDLRSDCLTDGNRRP